MYCGGWVKLVYGNPPGKYLIKVVNRYNKARCYGSVLFYNEGENYLTVELMVTGDKEITHDTIDESAIALELKKLRTEVKLLKEMVHSDRLPEKGLFPNFGPIPGVIYHGYHAVLIPEEQLHQYAEKLVRGMTYVLDGKVLDENFHIKLYVIDLPRADRLLQIFRKNAETHHRGLGFVVRRLIREDDQAWIYEFGIWQKLVFYVEVLPSKAKK